MKSNSKKIVFVDDDAEWRSMVGTWLHGAGYSVSTAKSIGECLKRVDQEQPDLAILDVNLAGEDGIVLMRSLKERHPDLPVILFTGLEHDDDTVLQFMRQGAHQYVRKGRISDLAKSVQMILDYVPSTQAPPSSPSQELKQSPNTK